MKQKIFFWLCVVLALAFNVSAQERYTENTLKLSPEKKSPAAALSDMAWLAGHWRGPAMGGMFEEIWSAPQGGAMMGMFRFVQNDKTVFYELMIIREHEGSIILQLKHFGPALNGWEEKDKTVDFRFVEKKADGVYFDGITFKPDDKNGVNIFLAMKQKNGTVAEEVFRYQRVPAAGK